MKTYGLLPAYNEGETIYEVVTRTKKMGITPIVIDDHSSDRTGPIAKKAGARVIRHKKNLGKGEAIKTGFEFLKNQKVNFVILMDTDMQYSPEEALKLLAPLKKGKADFVIGYRNWNAVPFRHRLGNLIWRNFFNFLFGTKFKDTNCGFMALNSSAMGKIKSIKGGYIIENALFVEALKNNLRIKQVPVNVVYKEKSGIFRGIRMVGGVLIFIVSEGIKYRLGL